MPMYTAKTTRAEFRQIADRFAEENANLRAQLSQAMADNERLKLINGELREAVGELTTVIDAKLEDENDRAYERAVIAAETTEPTPEEGRAAFFRMNRAFRAVLARMYCEATGRRSATPEEAGCFYLIHRAANERG